MVNNWLYAVIVKFTHAVSPQHEVSWNLYLKNEGSSLRERSDFNKGVNPSQSVIIEGLQRMTEKERDSLLKKIEIAQFVTYEEMSFTKYKELVKLEERHGVSLGEAYAGDNACKDFVRAIDGAMKDCTKENLILQILLG